MVQKRYGKIDDAESNLVLHSTRRGAIIAGNYRDIHRDNLNILIVVAWATHRPIGAASHTGVADDAVLDDTLRSKRTLGRRLIRWRRLIETATAVLRTCCKRDGLAFT